MPRFSVIRKIPALYVETWEVDAASEDEAQRSVNGGGGRCAERFFATTPDKAQPAGFVDLVVPGQSPASASIDSNAFADTEHPQEFHNARFNKTPGHANQVAWQGFFT